jgi:YYY domain-containing protein
MDNHQGKDLNRWLTVLLLLAILAGGSYLRYVGLDWDAEQHLHPDERFLTMVESSLLPVPDIREYFDTSISTLNPNNQGHGFYVYGTLPIFMVRYLAEWLGYSGYGSVYLVGRSLSAVMDLLSVVLAFFIGTRLYNRKVGILAAAFSSLAVLQIQQSHFFTVDTFATFFILLAIYFAVEIVTAGEEEIKLSSYLLFGAALGMAVASKINAAPVALTLPLAALLHWTGLGEEKRNQLAPRIVLFLVLAAFASLITFRIFQPYAFEGPGFINIGLNKQWVDGLSSLRAQTSGDVDFPPALQWARRPSWFSLQNMVVWGLGLPYGILSWVGFGWMGWKMFSRKSWKPDLVLWGWTGFYFVWQSLQWNSTMRYQLPIYPILAIFAGWTLVTLWDHVRGETLQILGRERSAKPFRLLVLVGGLTVLVLTSGWAFAFSRIYTTPHPRVAATRWIFQNIPGPANLRIETEIGTRQQLLNYPDGHVIQEGSGWLVSFDSKYAGILREIYFPRIINQNSSVNPVTLSITLTDNTGSPLYSAEETFLFDLGRTSGQVLISSPLDLIQGEIYQLRVEVMDPAGAVSLQGTGIANESSWDDGLPLRMDGYDPYGGIYQGGLNFEMYWDDNPEKLTRFFLTMDQAEYILITSSRQWGTTTRVPERYPLTTEFYRQLLGCPLDLTVEDCYNWALPGTYQGSLGFELIKTFQSNPNLGGLEINDQPSEEAFTVYDHPKVFVFKKEDDFDLGQIAEILGDVDLSRVIHITPKQADSHPGDLMLPADRLAIQRQGGTWGDLFNPAALINRSQFLAALVWYLAVFLLGLLVYPLLRKVFSGLNDSGYPLARTFGMLLFSYLAWLGGSAGIPVLRITLLGVLCLLAAVGLWTGYLQRESLIQEWKSRGKYYLIIEGLALGLFLIALLIRIGNPDLWHPWKGGEKPMDFSYLNAVLKSTTFPPYDPWFAGGYINYYYYGFVFVGMLVKLLGILPALAYNLILPTLFMMVGLGGFSLTWNLVKGIKPDQPREDLAYLAGGTGLLGLLIFGNLGILRMVFQGLQRLASGGVNVVDGNLFQRVKWTLLGFAQLFETQTLPYRLDEWYWNPSRAIGGEHGGPITEFPFFTFLYGDLHAHFIALPLTVLALAWVLSVVFSNRTSGGGSRDWVKLLAVPLFGALAVGALRSTNTWDFYPYLALGGAALLFAAWRDFRTDKKSWISSLARIMIFLIFAYLTFQPYANWYGQGYTSIKPWYGTHTPVNDFLVHWGLFLFLIMTWMVVETIDWMAKTPVSALSRLRKYRELIIAAILILGVIIISLGVSLEDKVSVGGFTILGTGVHIIWFVLPMIVWAGILIFRPDQPLAKQVVLFLIGTSLAITLMVELVYVEGDIGRMNTVFKFYLQAWTLFAVSAAAGFCWIVDSFRDWKLPLRAAWQVFFYILVTGAALYPLLGGVAKIKDRMSLEAPNTLDGMAYMQTAVYYDLDTRLDLSQDYRAIRWMQENIQGSPVIVEANQVEYHWATRYTVYTGLPGVVGWNWHQRQQRTLTPHEWVFSRVEDVNLFYGSADLDAARDFLMEYQVRYIVLGQLERANYQPEGIAKFAAGEGILWRAVYQDQDTIIYESLLEFD